MFDKIIAHTSFIGETGYANHSRSFFTALNKLIPVKVRNFTVGKTWKGLQGGEPHNDEWYLTDEHKNMLYKQTCTDNGNRTDHYIYGGNKEVEKGNNLHIVLNEVDHYYFYDKYDGVKIAYNVWESTLYPEHFYNKLLEFDQLWVPTGWQRDCVVKQGYNSNKVKIVPEAVDGNIFFPEAIKDEDRLEEYKDGRFKFLLFGRWDYRKSITEIIRTFLQTFGKSEPVDLVVSIDNPFSCDGISTTEDRLKKYGLDDERIKVKHFPSREDYVKYLKNGHVFLSCARSEGWNLPLIESIACGTPSIYSDWGAQLEFARGKGMPVKIKGEINASFGKELSFNGSIPGSYCEPDFEDLALRIRESYEGYKDYKIKALVESNIVRKDFSWENSSKKAYSIIKTICFNDQYVVNNIEKLKEINPPLITDIKKIRIEVENNNGCPKILIYPESDFDNNKINVQIIDKDSKHLMHEESFIFNVKKEDNVHYWIALSVMAKDVNGLIVDIYEEIDFNRMGPKIISYIWNNNKIDEIINKNIKKIVANKDIMDSNKDVVFNKVLNYLFHKDWKVNILETGCCSGETGGFSVVAAEFLSTVKDGKLITVDLSEKNMNICKEMTIEWSDKIEYRVGDSISFLRSLSKEYVEKLDLIYLDSYDIDIENPSPSEEHAFKELMTIYDNLSEDAVIMVDDNYMAGDWVIYKDGKVFNISKDIGKGIKIRDFLLKNGWEQIAPIKEMASNAMVFTRVDKNNNFFEDNFSNVDHLIDQAFSIGMLQAKKEITDFCNFIKDKKIKNILEIGSDKGATFYLWCKLSDKNGKKISLDLPHSIFCTHDFNIEKRNERMKLWSDNVHIVEGDSHKEDTLLKIKSILEGEKLDLLFIDGDHTYEGVKKDYEMYKDLVKDEGYIAFHDINCAEVSFSTFCDTHKFWGEVEGDKFEFNEHFHDCGIGVIKNKSNDINKENSIFVIGAWIDSQEREDVLKECIRGVKEFYDFPILLVSHCLINNEIINEVDYFLFDKENPLLYREDYGKYNVEHIIWFGNTSFSVHKNRPWRHDYAVVSSMRNACNFASSLNKENIIYLEYDSEVNGGSFRDNFVSPLSGSCACVMKDWDCKTDCMYVNMFSIKTDLFKKIIDNLGSKEEYYEHKFFDGELIPERLFLHLIKKECQNIFYSEYDRRKADKISTINDSKIQKGLFEGYVFFSSCQDEFLYVAIIHAKRQGESKLVIDFCGKRKDVFFCNYLDMMYFKIGNKNDINFSDRILIRSGDTDITNMTVGEAIVESEGCRINININIEEEDREHCDEIIKQSDMNNETCRQIVVKEPLIENKDIKNIDRDIYCEQFDFRFEDDNGSLRIFFKSKFQDSGKYRAYIRDFDTDLLMYSDSFVMGNGIEFWMFVPFQSVDGFRFIIMDTNRNIVFDKIIRTKEDRHGPSLGHRLFSDFDDTCFLIYKEVFIDEVYNHGYCKIVEGDVCLDIGANSGLFSIYACLKGASKVYSIEPCFKTFQNLLKNKSIKKEYDDIIIPFCCAISSSNGEMEFISRDEYSCANSLYGDIVAGSKKEVVKTININDFIFENNIEYINFMKIDAELAEYEILETIDECFLANRVDKLVVEFHDSKNRDLGSVLEKIKRCGFNVEITKCDSSLSICMLYAWKPDVDLRTLYNTDRLNLECSLNTKTDCKNTETNISGIYRESNLSKIYNKKTVFITGADEKYMPVAEQCVRGINEFSDCKIILYGFGCDVPFDYPSLIKRRIEVDDMDVKNQDPRIKFSKARTKCSIDAIDNTEFDTFIWLDADIVPTENIDKLTEFDKDIDGYPRYSRYRFTTLWYWNINVKGEKAYAQELYELLDEDFHIKDFVAAGGIYIYNKSSRAFFFEIDKMRDRVLSKYKEKGNYQLADSFALADEKIYNYILWSNGYNGFIPVTWLSMKNEKDKDIKEGDCHSMLFHYLDSSYSPMYIYNKNDTPTIPVPKDYSNVIGFHDDHPLIKYPEKSFKFTNEYIINYHKRKGIDKIMIVSHPDDDAIFGGNALLSEEGWKVVCTTCGNDPVRHREFIKAMEYANVIEYEIWNFKPAWNESYEDPILLKEKIEKILSERKYSKIVTHNPCGEYGNLQHKTLSEIIFSLSPENLYMFGIGKKIPKEKMSKKIELLKVYQSQVAYNDKGFPWLPGFDSFVYYEDIIVYDSRVEVSANNPKTFICFDSKSLGDNIAWVPYAEEYRKEHNCKVVLSTFWNDLFEKEYPEIEFIGRGEVAYNINKQYNIGWYSPWRPELNPNDFRTIPLQQTSSDILGLEYREIKPKIVIPHKPVNIRGKYICIGIHSTCQAKYWNYQGGWQVIVDYLNGLDYKVVHISKEHGTYMGNDPPNMIIDKTGEYSIDDRIVDLYYADMYIGIGSGLSWLSWAVGTPTIIISGFSNPFCEPKNGIERVHNPDVCNSCFNDPNIQFDPGDWNWCPRHKNFECSKSITPDMVIEKINKILEKK